MKPCITPFDTYVSLTGTYSPYIDKTFVNFVITLILVPNSFILCKSSVVVLDEYDFGLETHHISYTSGFHVRMKV